MFGRSSAVTRLCIQDPCTIYQFTLLPSPALALDTSTAWNLPNSGKAFKIYILATLTDWTALEQWQSQGKLRPYHPLHMRLYAHLRHCCNEVIRQQQRLCAPLLKETAIRTIINTLCPVCTKHNPDTATVVCFAPLPFTSLDSESCMQRKHDTPMSSDSAKMTAAACGEMHNHAASHVTHPVALPHTPVCLVFLQRHQIKKRDDPRLKSLPAASRVFARSLPLSDHPLTSAKICRGPRHKERLTGRRSQPLLNVFAPPRGSHLCLHTSQAPQLPWSVLLAHYMSLPFREVNRCQTAMSLSWGNHHVPPETSATAYA